MMDETDLGSLLINAEQLALNPEENAGELPKIDRTLKQVFDATNELWSRLASEGLRDNEASLLLSSRGVDLPNISQKLERITTRRSLQPLDPSPVTDIDSFLKNELDNSILATVDYVSQKLDTNFQNMLDNELKKTARDRRLKLLNCLNGISELDPEVPVLRKIYPLKELHLSGANNLDQYQIAYAEALIEHNRDIQYGKRSNLLNKFKAVVPEHDQKIGDLWKIASIMTSIPLSVQQTAIEARSGRDATVRNCLIAQARFYLEETYKKFMESVVNSNLLKASRGGEPGTYSLVKSFVKAANFTEYLGMEQMFADGLPFWPVFYFCLRCGDFNAALYTLSQLGGDFDDLIMVISEMKNSPERRLSTYSEKTFVDEYNRMVRNTPDPFKRIVYCFIGACDINDKHSEVIKTTDDFLWLRLSQINLEDPDDYNTFQRFIESEYGSTRVSAEQPYLYFQIYFLCGLFETAIQELYMKPHLAVHAVHIAIALLELGMLNTSDNLDRATFSSYFPLPQPHMGLNICTMVKTYVNTLANENIEISLNYLFTLRNICYVINKEKYWMFSHYAFELAVKTERYDEILGYLEPDGCRVKGLCDQFAGTKIRVDDLIGKVARYLETKGEHFTAMKLFELCGDYERTMWAWCTQMSNYLTDNKSKINQSPKSGTSNSYQMQMNNTNMSFGINNSANMSKWDATEATITNRQCEDRKKELYEYHEQFVKRTDTNTIDVHVETKNVFDGLHLLYVFHQLYKNNEHSKALSLMQQSKFLPFTSDEVEVKLQEFRSADVMVIQALPDALVALMEILSKQYANIKNNIGRQPDESFVKNVAPIREKAQALTSFTGRLPFQFTSSTYSIMMNKAVIMG